MAWSAFYYKTRIASSSSSSSSQDQQDTRATANETEQIINQRGCDIQSHYYLLILFYLFYKISVGWESAAVGFFFKGGCIFTTF